MVKAHCFFSVLLMMSIGNLHAKESTLETNVSCKTLLRTASGSETKVSALNLTNDEQMGEIFSSLRDRGLHINSLQQARSKLAEQLDLLIRDSSAFLRLPVFVHQGVIDPHWASVVEQLTQKLRLTYIKQTHIGSKKFQAKSVEFRKWAAIKLISDPDFHPELTQLMHLSVGKKISSTTFPQAWYQLASEVDFEASRTSIVAPLFYKGTEGIAFLPSGKKGLVVVVGSSMIHKHPGDVLIKYLGKKVRVEFLWVNQLRENKGLHAYPLKFMAEVKVNSVLD